MTNFRQQLSDIRNGLSAKTTGPKPKKPIAKVSAKKKAEVEADKAARNGGDTELQKWFNERRKELVGVCQCGCGRKSSKHEDEHFRSSICHILPQRLFKSTILHPLNYVERNFWEGCHSIFDNTSLNRWANMADFDDIKEKFKIISRCLTDAERAKKFYQNLEKLIHGNI